MMTLLVPSLRRFSICVFLTGRNNIKDCTVNVIFLFVVRYQLFSSTAGFRQEGELTARLSWLLIDIVVIITVTCSFAEQLLL